ncbi:MAG: hypothetical protein O2948_08480 [Proteobacteria bacterium]|nr:hypothetical protein [Pseudomonadota bacterium]
MSVTGYPWSPVSNASQSTAWRSLPDYPALAVLAGDEVNMRLISNEDHGAFVREGERGYNATVSAVLRLLGKATE